LRDFFKNSLILSLIIPVLFWDFENTKKKNRFFSFCLDMMTDTAIQQSTDTNGQTLVTPLERQSLIQKLYKKKIDFNFYRNFILIYIEMRNGRWNCLQEWRILHMKNQEELK